METIYKLTDKGWESELTAAREEIDILKSKYADHHAEAERIISEIKTVTEQRDRLAEALNKLATKRCEFCNELPLCENERKHMKYIIKHGEFPNKPI